MRRQRHPAAPSLTLAQVLADLRPGEILDAAITALSRASAFSVLSTGFAASRLRTGQCVCVDAHMGTVTVLATMTQQGLPVAPGFTISTAAFLVDLASTGLERPLAAQLGVADPSVAVRSSAPAEDAAGTRFAGGCETCVGVRGADAVRVECAGRCTQRLKRTVTPNAPPEPPGRG